MSTANEREIIKDALVQIRTLRAKLKAAEQTRHEPVAVIGAGCRFPGGVDSLDSFWALLRGGVDAISPIPSNRWDANAYYDPDPNAPGKMYVRHGGFLDDVETFDAEFFGISPREAQPLDPQQRLLLEVAWEALENGGIAPGSLRGTRAGLYVGVMNSDYAFRHAHNLNSSEIDPYMLSGNDTSFLAGRLAYFLGLQGPAMTVATACSSSLVTVHLACQALRAGECEMALAGGVNVIADPVTNIMLSKIRALAPDGRCKAFDAGADGYGRGEGCGVIVLERLSAALSRGHRILAVIRGSAVNHDGPSAGLTVPNGPAQENLIRLAIEISGIEGSDVGYVEAHGTGTALGDPVEIQSLVRALGKGRTSPLMVGSVKTNVGHLEAAAGIAGLIKTILALGHRQIPPHLHFRNPSAHIPWRDLPVKIVTELTEWPANAGGKGRIAGVSSFGLSGVNAHVVLEEPPTIAAPENTEVPGAHILTLSARTPGALQAQVRRYIEHFERHPNLNWADVCFTANTGRSHFPRRLFVIAETAIEACARLKMLAGENLSEFGADRELVASVAVAGTGTSGKPARSQTQTRNAAPPANAQRQALEVRGQAYTRGETIDWLSFWSQSPDRCLVDLPTYPFQRERFWLSVRESASTPDGVPRGTTPQQGPLLLSSLQDKSSEELAQLIGDALSLQVSGTLQLGVPPDPDKPLFDLGMDSLMASDLKTWVRRDLEIDVDLREFLSGASVRTLTRLLILRLGEPRKAAPQSGASGNRQQNPLSYGQRALWFIHESDPQSAAYNVAVALRVRSSIEVPALRGALQALVDRHSSLRTTFSVVEDQPVQNAHGAQKIHFEQTPAAGCSEEDLIARLARDYRLPFDLSRGPLFRTCLYTRSSEDHVLMLVMHHIICDAVSCWKLLEELQILYTAQRAGRSAVLPAIRLSYADYVAQQLEFLAGAAGERLWSYWRQQLPGEPAPLNLPMDLPRPALQTYNGGSVKVIVPQKLTDALRELSRSQQVTLFTTVLSAFQVLLGRYSGQTDILVGSATTGRSAPFSDVVGYFVNPVVIRGDLAGDPNFLSFLRQMRRTVLDALDHQEFPFPLLVERLQPKRDYRRSPLFQVDFAMSKPAISYRPAMTSESNYGLRIEPFEVPEEEGQFDLGLHATENTSDITAVFKYNRDLFEKTTIERMAQCFVTLIESIVENPLRPVSRIPLLSQFERARLLALGKGEEREIPRLCVHQMFEFQVEATPDAIAVEDSNRQLTYRELNAEANRLAHVLKARGIEPEKIVGVCIEPSGDLVAGVLGVLKAGGAYLPLDAGYPPERLAFMMSDAGITVTVTTRRAAGHLPKSDNVERICIDDCRDEDNSNLPASSSLENLAYVIYTSGSMGRPKGTLVTHTGLTNYLSWCVDAYAVPTGSGAPVNTAFGFDATITSFFSPLICGRTVVLLPRDTAIESLSGMLAARAGFSLLKITPAHLEILSQLLSEAECSGGANVFVIGGEALRPDMLTFWQERAPRTRLINEYGPTETVVGCCVYEVSGPLSGTVPIGGPIANTQLYVLDNEREPVPHGVIGELYIGGAGVARGYLGQPDLTASRFIKDPFSKDPAARLYRTGDLVRYRPDCNLDFVGRADNQLKIRGYRIEPGEIENILSHHPLVSDSVVEARDVGGTYHLVAYIAAAGEPPSGAELRRHLSVRLPDYMIPSFFIVLDEFPLTPNGKVDRKALPPPQRTAPDGDFVAPRDPMEMKLAALWQDILGVRTVGMTDNFFDIGGHSLLAVRLIARIRKDLGIAVPLAAILRGPTVEELADILRRKVHNPGSLVPIQPKGVNRPFFCIPGAGGNAIYLYSLAQQLGESWPFYGLQGVGMDGEAPPHTSVAQMAEHYIEAIRTVQPHGPYSLGGHSLGGWVAFEMAQRLLCEGEKIAVLAIIDTPAPVPSPPRDVSDWDEARWIGELSSRIAHLLNPGLHLAEDDLRGLSPDDQLKRFRDALMQAELSPVEVELDHLRHVLEMFKAHSGIQYTFPENILAMHIDLFRTAHAPADLPLLDNDETWGWSSAGSVDVHRVTGEHLTVLRQPHVQVLAGKLSTCLSERSRECQPL